MKASIKFRGDQNALLRAKVPLNILGLPFQSGIVASDANDLTLHLSTFFQSGPSISLAYRPNDSTNTFSLFLKTGTGPFGSPIFSSMLMTAEFSLLSTQNPKFMLHFKPQFGDFSFKSAHSSYNPVFSKATPFQNSMDDDASIEVVENQFVKRVTAVHPHQQHAAQALSAAFTGVEVSATTKLPKKSRAVMSFRWGVRIPLEIGKESTVGIDLKKIPFLVMNKIGVEQVSESPPEESKAVQDLKTDDAEETCVKLKRQVEWLRLENSELRRAVDDMRQDIGFDYNAKLNNNNNNNYNRRYGEAEKYERSHTNGSKAEKKDITRE